MLVAIPCLCVQLPCEGRARELAALIRVDNLSLADPRRRLIHRIKAEHRLERNRQNARQRGAG